MNEQEPKFLVPREAAVVRATAGPRSGTPDATCPGATKTDGEFLDWQFL